MTDTRVVVRIDDRFRLMSALLALTDWPQREQEIKLHGIHSHAKATRRDLAQFANHDAVLKTQEMLDMGRTPDELFRFAQTLSWPSLRAKSADLPEWAAPGWTADIRSFFIEARLLNLWKLERPVWETAVEELQTIFEQGDILKFLTPYLGAVRRKLVFYPNLSFPTMDVVSFADDQRYEVACIVPPRMAWGNNPPWPYDDDPAWVYRVAFEGFGRVLVRNYLRRNAETVQALQEEALPVPDAFREAHPDWSDQFTRVFVGAATAIFLEETSGKEEAAAYIMMEHKSNNFDVLPSVVSVFRHYLAERDTGKYSELADYLPHFRDSLRLTQNLGKI